MKAKRALNLKQTESNRQSQRGTPKQNPKEQLVGDSKKENKEVKRKSKTKTKTRGSEIKVVEAEIHSDGNIEENQVPALIRKLSSDMHAMHANTQKMMNELHERMVSMEKDLEKKITNNIAKTVDKRITTEMTKMRKDIDSKVQSVKDEFMADLNNMAEDINELSTQIQNNSAETRTTEASEKQLALNIAVRNVGEKPRENVKNEVNKIIKDGIGIFDVEVSSAERRVSAENKPGVIFATFKSIEDKKKVMEKKKNLKTKQIFSNIFIHHDQSRDQRKNSKNLRVLVDAIKTGKTDKLSVRGTAIVMAEDDESSARTTDVRNVQSNNANENRNSDRNTGRRFNSRNSRDSGYNTHHRESRRGERREYSRDRLSDRNIRYENNRDVNDRYDRDRQGRDWYGRDNYHGRDRYSRDTRRDSYYYSSDRNTRRGHY